MLPRLSTRTLLYPCSMASRGCKKISPSVTFIQHGPNTRAQAKTEVQTQLGILTLGWHALPEDLPKWKHYPFEDLVPGQTFQIPYKRGHANRVREAARQWCSRRGVPMCFKVVSVMDHGKMFVRCWRLGTPEPAQAQEVETTERAPKPGPVNL